MSKTTYIYLCFMQKKRLVMLFKNSVLYCVCVDIFIHTHSL